MSIIYSIANKALICERAIFQVTCFLVSFFCFSEKNLSSSNFSKLGSLDYVSNNVSWEQVKSINIMVGVDNPSQFENIIPMS